MKNKFFTLLLAVMASVGTMFASNISVDGIWYDFDSSTQTATVTYRGDSYDSYANEYSGSVTIPSSVTYNEMTYSVTTIGENAFQYCTELTLVTIPNSVTYIAWAAFSACTGLTSVEIPNGVIWIGHYAFSSCTGLTSVTIPNSVKSVGHGAFRYCISLTSVTIPSSVTDIKSEAFANCTSLLDINIESGNLNYCSVDGIVFNKEKTSIICYPAGKTNTEYNIPNNITSIEDDAFVGCRSLTSVNIPNSVTSIGRSAFQYCTSLTSVTIPSSVTYIGGSSFYGCTGLTSVAIPSSISSIENYTFYGCVSLNSIIIPSSVTSIGEGALSSCTGLTSVTNYATKPQTINANVFNKIVLSNLTLIIPAQSFEAYKAVDVWKDFGNFEAIQGEEGALYASIAHVYNMAQDSAITMGAFDVVYVASYQNGANIYIKDETGSLVIYKPGYGLQAGDHVEAGMECTVNIYHGLYEIVPVSAKEDLTIIQGEAPAPMEAVEVPTLANVNQYVVFKNVSFATDTAFVEGRRHAVSGIWNDQEINFYNQYFIGATLKADKTYNIVAVNTVYGTKPQAYPLSVEEVMPCITASGTCGENLTWTFSCDNVLTISGTGAMESYSYCNCPWSEYLNAFAIKSIVIEEGVTALSTNAFSCSIVLSNVDVFISSTVTSIDHNAFNLCGPAFYVNENNPNFSSIDGILFNKDQTKLIAYPRTKTDKQYTIPNTVNTIGVSAFNGCDYLESVIIPNSVKTIEEYAFRYCYGLTSVSIANSVENIGYDAFQYCDRLTTVYIPSSVISIGNSAFGGDHSLQSINVDEANPNYSSLDGVLFNKDQTTLLQYPLGKECAQYVIPNTVTTIGVMAFYFFNGDNTELIIPNTVVKIEHSAFFSTSRLNITNFATVPQSITASAFSYTDLASCALHVPAQSLEVYKTADVWKDFGTILPIDETPCLIASGACGNNLTWELSCDSVLTISGTGDMWILTEEQAWRPYKESIKVVILPEGLDSIAPKAFYQCENLTSVNLPNSVRAVGYAAFYECAKIAEPVYNDRILAYMPFTYTGTYTVPEGIESLASYAFQPSSDHYATEIVLPSSLKQLGAYSLGWGYQKLTCLATTPPVCDKYKHGVFSFYFDDAGVVLSVDRSIPVYVPAGSVEAYKAADQWKDFFNIQAIPTDPQDANLNVVYIDPSNNEIQREAITLHLPAAPTIEGFTFLKWQVVAGDLEDAIFIQAVYTENDPQLAPAVYTNPANPTQKLIRNGNVYILTGDKVYTITGQAVK